MPVLYTTQRMMSNVWRGRPHARVFIRYQSGYFALSCWYRGEVVPFFL